MELWGKYGVYVRLSLLVHFVIEISKAEKSGIIIRRHLWMVGSFLALLQFESKRTCRLTNVM